MKTIANMKITKRARAMALALAFALALACALTLAGCGDSGAGAGAQGSAAWPASRSTALTADDVPEYAGETYIEINGGKADFTKEELALAKGVELYGDLDRRGRVTEALACVGPETMPTGERGDISEIHPTGWHQAFYDNTDEDYLMTRSHMIAFCLSGENANERNLFTGTHCMNANVMTIFEEGTARYIDKTGNHVLYFVDPVFDGNDLMPFGVHMKARSIEDNGAGINFNVFIYNVERGVTISYETGKSRESATKDAQDYAYVAGTQGQGAQNAQGYQGGQNGSSGSGSSGSGSAVISGVEADEAKYVLNVNSRKFHLPTCDGAASMNSANREYSGSSREDLLAAGYVPCGSCNP